MPPPVFRFAPSPNGYLHLGHAYSALLNFDLALISQVLREPVQQPEYRAARSHEEFLTNVELSSQSIEAALIEAWGAAPSFSDYPEIHDQARSLAASRYEREEWNRRF